MPSVSGRVDPVGLYTGTTRLYPEDPHFKTVSQLSLHHGDPHPATPSALGATIMSRTMSRDPAWITLPGSSRAPAIGVPGPGSRKGEVVTTYDRESHSYHRIAATYHRQMHQRTFGSLPRSGSASLNNSFGSLGVSPSQRSLRLDARAAGRRPMSALLSTSRIPSRVAEEAPARPVRPVPIWDGSKFRKEGTVPRHETAPGLGFGSKFYYRD